MFLNLLFRVALLATYQYPFPQERVKVKALSVIFEASKMVKVPCLTDQLTIWFMGVTNLISNFYMNLYYTRVSLQFHLMMIV